MSQCKSAQLHFSKPRNGRMSAMMIVLGGDTSSIYGHISNKAIYSNPRFAFFPYTDNTSLYLLLTIIPQQLALIIIHRLITCPPRKTASRRVPSPTAPNPATYPSPATLQHGRCSNYNCTNRGDYEDGVFDVPCFFVKGVCLRVSFVL